MREQLQGRNLAHVGCLIGLILGLSGGIMLAWELILHNVATTLALIIWVGLTVVLGTIGFFTGTAVSDKGPRPSDVPGEG